MATTDVLDEAAHPHRKKCSVEIVPPPGLRATLEAECYELEPVLKPTDIISDQQRFRIRVKWCVHGELRRHLCGTWCVSVAYESCGPAEEGQVIKRIPFDPCLPDDRCYELDFDFEPGTLAPGDCGTVYCFCVTLSSETTTCPDGQRYAGLIFGFCRDVCCIMVRSGSPTPTNS
jgi:hypothetical protein